MAAGCDLAHCPPETRRQLSALTDRLAGLFAADFVGLYLHGSLALGGFQPARSDLDLIAVVRQRPEAAARRGFAAALLELSGAPQPVEISVLTAGDLRAWRHPFPYALHFSEAWRARCAADLAAGAEADWAGGLDPDLAAHLTVLNARGLGLAGPPIAALFPRVPPADFLAALRSDLEWARPRLAEQPAYAVLNAARIQAYVRTGRILSKAEGGAWARAHADPRWRPALDAALAVYTGEPAPVDRPLADAFLVETLAQLSEALPHAA